MHIGDFIIQSTTSEANTNVRPSIIEVPQDVEFFDSYHFYVASTDESSSTSEHYYCRLQQPTTSGTNKTSFKDYNYNSTSTRPTKNLLNWVGCGADGHAFAVLLGCSSTQQPTQKLFYEVVLKVSTSGKRTQLGYKFISFEDSKREEMTKVYKTLVPKSAAGEKESTLATQRTLRKHFKLPFGTIEIPLHEIYPAVLMSQEHPPSCHIGVRNMNRISPDDSNVTAMLMEKADGVMAIDKKMYMIEHWKKLIKDLILSYEHMWFSEFSHQDITLYNIMVEESESEIQAQFIDFDRHAFLHQLPVQDKKRLQQVQFYQLLSLVANVCDDNDPKRHDRISEKFHIPNGVRIRYVELIQNRTFIQELIVPLVTNQRCAQIFQPPLSLSSNTTESNNVTSSIKTTMLTNQLYPYLIDTFGNGSDTIKDISDGYEILLHWISNDID